MYTVTASTENIVIIHETFKNGLDAAIMVNHIMADNRADRIEVDREGGEMVQEYERSNDGARWFVRGASVQDWKLITVAG